MDMRKAIELLGAGLTDTDKKDLLRLHHAMKSLERAPQLYDIACQIEGARRGADEEMEKAMLLIAKRTVDPDNKISEESFAARMKKITTAKEIGSILPDENDETRVVISFLDVQNAPDDARIMRHVKMSSRISGVLLRSGFILVVKAANDLQGKQEPKEAVQELMARASKETKH